MGIGYVKVFRLDGTWKPTVSYPRLPFWSRPTCWNLLAKTVGRFSLQPPTLLATGSRYEPHSHAFVTLHKPMTSAKLYLSFVSLKLSVGWTKSLYPGKLVYFIGACLLA
jgi:hypothetical protein